MLSRTVARHLPLRRAIDRGFFRSVNDGALPYIAVTTSRCRYKSSASTLASEASSSTVASASSSAATSSKKGALPYLPRPLGVQEPPTTLRKSWRDDAMALMDQDVRLARRKHIVKEATKGYYSDLNAIRTHGGKTWIAPQTLVREDHALYFPDISGTTLLDKNIAHTTDICKGKVSVVAMLSTAISEEHIDSFVRETNEEFLSNPHYRFVQINLQENIAKAFLVSLYVSSLRRKIPEELHSTYLMSKQNMEYAREPLGMNNKHIGFVYLLDQNLRVRWAGGGLATAEESASLRTCAKVLLDRMGKSGS
ncbi:hypothetical protein EW145_g4364 [Phellinidium pouzarii]|uniref:Uncharacterized protein n=1 Tax=Phellinidium pouzarii TaxID=167371 RepID=A0A4S4L3X9_9AGAM|nr:hypothetical protein EW145_g4364 [Phellinidium pouzarii]